jgi:hypothetical protein
LTEQNQIENDKNQKQNKKVQNQKHFFVYLYGQKKLKTGALFLFGVTQSKLENWRFQVESFQD